MAVTIGPRINQDPYRAQVYMYFSPRSVASRLLLAGLFVSSLGPSLLAQSSVRQIKVIDSKGAVEIEVEASDRIIPQTQVLAGPDRLVIDFPNAVPGSQLRSQSVNRGEVKDVRIGLFQSRPPITRLVLDLKAAQSYQVFPYGRTVMIKIIGAPGDSAAGNVAAQPVSRPGLINTSYPAGTARIANVAARPPLEVSFRDGFLSIHASKATLSEVLFSVQQRTGADISIPPGAEQERVVADLGPGPAQEVLAHLLNGSRFNFLILNSADDPRRLDRVVLSPRGEPGQMFQPIQANDQPEDDGTQAEAETVNVPPPPVPVPATPPDAMPRPRSQPPEYLPQPEDDPH
jgi:hypothetical protein